MLYFVTIISIYFVFISPSTGNPIPDPGTQSQPFVGTFVFPHGGITLDADTRDFTQEPGNLPNSKTLATQLHNAMKKAAVSLIQTKPDLIILSTPHGFYLEEHYVFTASPEMSGNAGWSWSNFSAKFNIAKQESIKMYLELRKGNPVELLSLGIGHTTMPLMWAEVIPMWFIQQAALEAGFQLPPVIYIGQPPKTNLPELLKLGGDIVRHARKDLLTRRIAVVVSGDLSHRHSHDPQAPYGYDPSSAIFDGHIKSWAMIDRNPTLEEKSSQALLKDALGVSDAAGSCGYTGLVMLHGMLQELVQDGFNFKNYFFEYAAPTYFGMTVTSWLPE